MGYFQILASALLYSTVGIIVKSIQGISEFSILFFAYLFSLLPIVLYILLFVKERRFSFRKGKYVILMGLANISLLMLQFIAVRNTSIAIAFMLLYTAPVYVYFLSPIILKEEVKKGYLLLIFAVVGIILMVEPLSIDWSSTNTLGIVAAFLSGLAFAFFFIGGRYLSESHQSHELSLYYNSIGLVVLMPAAFIVPAALLSLNLPFLLFLGGGVIGLGTIFYFLGIGKVSASAASITALIEPVGAIVLALIFLHEIPSLWVVIGGFFILLSVYQTFK